MENNIYKGDMQMNKNSTDHSILGKVLDFQETYIKHESYGLNLYKKSPLATICDREVIIFDRHKRINQKVLMFGSNNYLGAIVNKDIINKTIEVTKEFGIGSGGVPLLSGTTLYHNKLENLLSELTGFDDTMLFSSGFTANIGVISGLIRSQNLIVHDRLNHASLLDGSIMCGAKMVRYKHNDPVSLEKILSENHENYPAGVLVITDSVFSMDGDIANIPEILKVVRKYNALLLIDEAHSTGVIGENGAGILSHFDIKDKSGIILSGTFVPLQYIASFLGMKPESLSRIRRKIIT